MTGEPYTNTKPLRAACRAYLLRRNKATVRDEYMVSGTQNVSYPAMAAAIEAYEKAKWKAVNEQEEQEKSLCSWCKEAPGVTSRGLCVGCAGKDFI